MRKYKLFGILDSGNEKAWDFENGYILGALHSCAVHLGKGTF